MIWVAALEDLGARCSVDTTLDAEYVKRRIAEEGESFLTTTLPQFGKDFERSLEDLVVSPTMFFGFTRRSRVTNAGGARMRLKGGLPQFLQGFTSIVFDDSIDATARELNDLQATVDLVQQSQFSSEDWAGTQATLNLHDLLPPIAKPRTWIDDGQEAKMADAIAAVRQLSLMFGKEKSICSQTFVDQAVEEFKRTDEELIDPFSTEE
jgi:hypothetical protein